MSFLTQKKGLQYILYQSCLRTTAVFPVRKTARSERTVSMKLKRAGIITWIIIIALVVSLSVMLINRKNQIDDLRQRREALQQEVTDKEITNAALEYELDHQHDDDTIADIARDELGLVSPGEIVFYDSAE